jgi:hypothetical protein
MPTDTHCERHKKIILESGCPANICEDITIKVPIEVCAHSEVCDAEFTCAGHTIEKVPCDDRGCNRFNVVQRINLRIPLVFKAECDVSEGTVDFDVHECPPNAKQSMSVGQ